MSAVLDDLVAALERNACTVHPPCSAADARSLVAERAAVHAGPGGLVALTPDHPLVGGLDVAGALVESGLALLTPDDPGWTARLASAAVGITGADLAVAEQGALGLAARPGVPRAASLVPPVHCCLVRTDTIVAAFADAVDALADEPLPSAFCWIGGPSRTGDLEMELTLGVHGPVAVEVVLVEPAA